MASISSALTPSLAARSLGFAKLSARIFCHASILTPSEMPPTPRLALAGRVLIFFVAQRTWLSPSPRGKECHVLEAIAATARVDQLGVQAFEVQPDAPPEQHVEILE